MAEIDNLNIVISAESKSASTAIDNLISKLNKLETNLSSLEKANVSGLSGVTSDVAKAVKNLDGLNTATLSRVTNTFKKLSEIDSTNIYVLSSALNGLGTASQSAQNVGDLAKNLSKLGNKGVQNAITNIPQLATAMNQLLTTLSRSPNVSSNIIQMTNALANLASQGQKISVASNAMANGINRYSASARNAKKHTTSLAAAFGKFYASYFLVIRGIKALWGTVETASDYLETLNYFEEAFGQVAKTADLSQWEELGYESAEAYANSFSKRASELTAKMTGFQVLSDGTLQSTGLGSLGINPSDVMQYQAMFGQMSSSMRVASETALKLSDVLTMIGADLASVRNMKFDAVWKDMASGLAGMSRTLDKYGVNIRNVNLQQKLNELGIEANIQALNQNEKALLRGIILLENTQYAWGDLAETLNAPANQLRLLSSNMENLSRIIGNLFLPTVQKVLPYINGFIIALQRLFTWIGTAMGIDLSGIVESTGENPLDSIIDGSEELEETLGDTLEASEKLKKSLRGFDELKTISSETASLTTGTDVSIGITGGVLDTAFEQSLAEYQKAWDEAFANMENKAEEFADIIVEKFDFQQIAKSFGELTDKVEKFNEAVKPFTSGFGEGFLGFFKTLAGTSFELIVNGLDAFADVLDKLPPDTLENVGKAMGTLAGSVALFVGMKKISDTFTALSNGFKALGGALSGNPILATFAISAGILALIDMFNESGDGSTISEGYEEIKESIDGISSSLDELNAKALDFENEMDVINSGGKLGVIYNEWSELNSKVGELTDEEKGKLKEYGDYITNNFPGLKDYIDENGKAYGNAALEVEKVLKNAIELYKIEATKELYIDAFKAQVEAERKLMEALDANAAYAQELRNTFSKLSEEELQQAIDNYNKIGQFTINGKSAMNIQLERSGYTGNLLEALFSDKKELNWDMFLTGGVGSKKDAEDFIQLGVDANNAIKDAQIEYEKQAEIVETLENNYYELTNETKSLKDSTDGLTDSVKDFNSVYDGLTGEFGKGELIKNGTKQLDTLDDMFNTRPKEMGENVGKGVEEGVNKSSGGAIGSMGGLGNSMLSRFAEVCQIHSPSKVMEEYGEYLIDGLVNGITSNLQRVLDSISFMGDKMQEKLYSYDFAFPSIKMPSYSSYAKDIVSQLNNQDYSGYSLSGSYYPNSAVESSESIKVDVTLDLDGETIYRNMLQRESQRVGTGRNSFKTIALTK